MPEKTKKFSLANIKILPKLLLIMLVLSWIPLAGTTIIGIKSRNEAISFEMENTILNVISGSAQDIRQGTNNMLMENLTVAQSVLLDPTIYKYTLDYTPGTTPEITPAEGMALVNRLQEFVASTDSLQKIEIQDPSGVVLVSTDLANIGTDNSTREDVQDVLAGSQFSESILRGTENNSFGLYVSIPLKNQSGTVGVISLQLQTEFINALIQNVSSDTTGVNVIVMETDGNVLAHSNPTSELGNGNPDQLPPGAAGQNQNNTGGLRPSEAQSMSSLSDAIKTALETNTSGRIRFCHPDNLEEAPLDDCSNGEWSQVAYEIVPDPIHKTPIFLVIVEVLENNYQTAAVRQTVISVVSAAVVGIVLVVVSVFVARSMAKPIQRMAEAANQVEQEVDFDPKTLSDISSQKDEIGMLAHVFSNMVMALQKREQKLKREIKKLKIEIDAKKQQEEIDQIVNQDFFQDLQKKAKDFKKNRGKS